MGDRYRMNLVFESYMRVASVTSPGRIRTMNEDSFAEMLHDGCFLVADGMGGGEAGEIASRMLCDEISDVITNSRNDLPGLRKYNIQQKLHVVNRDILTFAQNRGYTQMGTTLALLLFDTWNPCTALTCHVGDSRIYRIRNRKIQRLTSDHTIGAELQKTTQKIDAKSGFIDHRSNSLSHILTKAVGVSHSLIPEWTPVDVSPLDRFLVCSDGVTTMLSEHLIEKIINESTCPEDATADLSNAVLQAGAKDNFTAILIDIQGNIPSSIPYSPEEGKENDYIVQISEERIDNV